MTSVRYLDDTTTPFLSLSDRHLVHPPLIFSFLVRPFHSLPIHAIHDITTCICTDTLTLYIASR